MSNPTPPAVPGLHGDFIQARLPGWLKHANAGDFTHLKHAWQRPELPALEASASASAEAEAGAALRDYQQRSRQSSIALAEALKKLQGIAAFAEPLLKERLKFELGVELDINRVEFVHILRESILFGTTVQTRPRQQTLLQAALQNFSASAEIDPGSGLAPADGFGLELLPGSATAYPRFRYVYHQRLSIDPVRFARLCHGLDLGGSYQQHLNEVFDAPASRERVRALWVAAYQDQLRVNAQIAGMRGEISASAQQMLLALADGQAAPLLHGKPVRISQLKLFEAPLGEVLVISADRVRSTELEPVLVYLPGAPLYPLKEYPSALAARNDLRINLRLPAYQALLRRYLAQADQARVLARLDAALYQLVEGRDGVFERQANSADTFYVRENIVEGELFAHLYRQHLDKLRADAQLLAVPSAIADEQAREARLSYWASIGFNLVNAAAFFIPALGAVMAAVTAVQLVREVVIGVEDWEHGDLDQAWEHLSAVGFNLALMAGLGMAGHAAVPVANSELLDGLVRVTLHDGSERLWRPSLDVYAVPVELGQFEPDVQGLYHIADRRYVRIEGRSHQVRVNAEGRWRVVHPDEPGGYEPPLVHNGQGAWRLQAEDPLQWQGSTLWRRLGHRVAGLSDEDLLKLAQATGTDDACLRRIHLHSETLPPALDETLGRWQLHRDVRSTLARLHAGLPLAPARMSLPLQLLTQMPGWPADVLLQVLEEGQVLGEWGDTGAGEHRLLSLSPAQLVDGSYRQPLLALLSDAEQKALIGPYLESAVEARSLQLQQALSGFAAQQQALIFELFEAAEVVPDEPAMYAIRRDFPGLPWRAAKALAAHANSPELEQLLGTPSRMPLRLAEEARWLLEDAALNRACEGLHFAYQDSAEIRRLALGELQNLQGWSASLQLEVRDLNWRGELLDSVGAADAPKKYLVRRAGGYQALDQAGQELGAVESFYAAILHALPDSERIALGVDIHQPELLRQMLADCAANDRAGARRILGQRPRNSWFQPPMQLDDGQRGYPLSGRGDGSRLRSPAVLERVRLLYPDLSLAETNQLLDEAGVAEAQLARWLEGKHRELNALLTELDDWVESSAWVTADPHNVRRVPAQARRNVADLIERCWRRQGERITSGDGSPIGYRLDLSNQRIGQLPPLSGDFSHVGSLHLNDTGIDQIPGAFLGVFSRLRWLSAARNQLVQLPEAVAERTGLTKLLLPGNAIVLDAEGVTRLTQLQQLKILQLDNSPLGLLPDLAQFADLRGVLLRNTGQRGWPAGVFELPELEMLDLRDNLISNIPEEVLAPAPERLDAVTRVNRVTSLIGNPLNQDSMARVEAYYSRTGISLGTGVQGTRLRLPVVIPAEEAAARWEADSGEVLSEERRARWRALSEEPDSAAFFGVLNDLQNSADFEQAFSELRARVWAVLDAAVQDVELREQLFEAAGHPNTCSDGVTLIFSQLEVLVLVRQALAAPSAVETERSLLQLVRGLTRLDRVESIALKDIAERRGRGLRPDEVEVRLAYRIGLAEALELPGQARYMNFRGLAGVSALQLELAKAAVLAAETPAMLKQACVEREFWVGYLKKHFDERFNRVNKPYYARLEALEKDKEGMTDQMFKQQIETINKRRQAEEKRLLESLTVEVWNGIPGQSVKLLS